MKNLNFSIFFQMLADLWIKPLRIFAFCILFFLYGLMVGLETAGKHHIKNIRNLR